MLRLVPFAAQAPRAAPSLLWRALSTAPTPAVIHKQFTEKLQSAREKAMLGGGQDRVDKQVCLCVCVSVCLCAMFRVSASRHSVGTALCPPLQ